MTPFLSVIIPAYNEGPKVTEAIRCTAEYLSQRPYTWEIIVVNDGSHDDTLNRILAEAGRTPQLQWVSHPVNQGKGAAVRTGLRQANGKNILFCDADGATPIQELARLLPHLEQGAELVVGSRRMAGSRIHVRQKRLRRFLSGGYRWICKFFVTPGISDVTCGFKLLSRRAADLLLPRMQINGWSFDAEIFAIGQVHHLKIAQVPVEWADQKNTKVRLKRDVFESFLELVEISLHKMLGKYR